MAQTLIRAGWVVTMDPGLGVLRNGGVLIEGDRIAKVGPNLACPPATEVMDAPGAIVIPGLVNAHHHTWQTIAKRGHLILLKEHIVPELEHLFAA